MVHHDRSSALITNTTQETPVYEDDEFIDCELCDPSDDSEPHPYAHCCGCGADGSSERPDCICE